jgi:organic hydroperoxide reductase OsmC/OhrA
MSPFPHHYRVTVDRGRIDAPPRAAIEGGAPPQFGGVDTVWSPEELLASAVALCLWTTFDAFAKREQLVVSGWRCQSEAVLDRSPTGPTFTAIKLQVTMSVAAEKKDQAEALLHKAKKHCIVGNALRCPVELEIVK